MAKALGVTEPARANHSRKEYVTAVSVPAPKGSSAAKTKLRRQQPGPKDKLRLKGGDNRTEASFGAV